MAFISWSGAISPVGSRIAARGTTRDVRPQTWHGPIHRQKLTPLRPILRKLESQLSDAAGSLLALTCPIFVAAADADWSLWSIGRKRDWRFSAQRFPDHTSPTKLTPFFTTALWRPSSLLLRRSFDAEISIAAFEAGKHVYLEKPIALDVDDARRILRAWRSSGKIGMIGYNFRFSHAARAAIERIRSGELGEILAVHGCFQWAAGKQVGGWRSEPGKGGDALLDLASHHIDLFGDPPPTRFENV